MLKELQILEDYIKKEEAETIARMKYILSGNYSDRIKRKLIYEQHLNCSIKINQWITEACKPEDKSI